MLFKDLKKILKIDFSSLKKVKVALLGDTATQFLAQGIKANGYMQGFNIDFFEAEYNQIESLFRNKNSDLYNFAPEYIIVFEATHKLLKKYNKTKSASEKVSFAENYFSRFQNLLEAIRINSSAKVIYFNYYEIDDKIFGNYSNKVEESFLFQLRKLNFLISSYVLKTDNLNIYDISSLQNKIGRDQLISPQVYVNSDMILKIDIIPKVTEELVKIIVSNLGKIKKCLILDLDNTMWGGIIGDDGIENIKLGSLGIGKAFNDFQEWVKKLKERGIILCVCSKNTENIAKEVFEKHPDMVIKLNDISVFMANWDTKVENIYKIQKILNIGFDSMVFLDDNPFERNMIREAYKDILVPELPEDPAEYLEYLYSLNIFETNSYSEEDSKRTEQYIIKNKIESDLGFFDNEDDFLKSLSMISKVESFNPFSIPRVAQLSQRSNQFNLRTKRYSEFEVKNMMDSENYVTYTFTLEDKYGDNGTVCVVILEKINEKDLFVDTWFMSCRVLKRGLEKFVLNSLAEDALREGFKRIIGEYIPTEKNIIVKDHYLSLGFIEVEDKWALNLEKYEKKECYIEKECSNGKK